jgi:hypothetical protein
MTDEYSGFGNVLFLENATSHAAIGQWMPGHGAPSVRSKTSERNGFPKQNGHNAPGPGEPLACL